MNHTIKLEPGCLDNVPVRELARFLASHGLEMVYKPDGLRIRRSLQPLDYPDLTDLSVSPSPGVFAPGEMGGRGD
jgi:hypothetical protein